MRFPERPFKHDVPPPALGWHTNEMLRSLLKKNDVEIAKLKEEDGGLT